MVKKAKKKAAGSDAKDRKVEKRWTKKLADAGWSPISDFFLGQYTRLNPPMTSVEAMFVIHLMSHKWDEDKPHPGFKRIARRMGVTDASTRGYARSLEKKGYLARVFRESRTNLFDLSPLFIRLEERLAEVNAQKAKTAKGEDESK